MNGDWKKMAGRPEESFILTLGLTDIDFSCKKGEMRQYSNGDSEWAELKVCADGQFGYAGNKHGYPIALL